MNNYSWKNLFYRIRCFCKIQIQNFFMKQNFDYFDSVHDWMNEYVNCYFRVTIHYNQNRIENIFSLFVRRQFDDHVYENFLQNSFDMTKFCFFINDAFLNIFNDSFSHVFQQKVFWIKSIRIFFQNVSSTNRRDIV